MYLALVGTIDVGEKRRSRSFELCSENIKELKKQVKARTRSIFVNKTTGYKITPFVETTWKPSSDIEVVRLTSLVSSADTGMPIRIIEIEIQEIEEVD